MPLSSSASQVCKKKTQRQQQRRLIDQNRVRRGVREKRSVENTEYSERSIHKIGGHMLIVKDLVEWRDKIWRERLAVDSKAEKSYIVKDYSESAYFS